MCGNLTSTSTRTREYPHNIPANHRRFKNGVWQKPTAKRRGWEPSLGLSGLNYEQGIEQITRLNRIGRDIVVVGVGPMMAPVANDIPTDSNHRRFNTVTQIWERPNRSMTGWEPSGIADRTLEEGNAFFARHEANGSRYGYINLGAVTPGAAVEVLDKMARRFNVALGIWERPNRDLTGWVPSSGLEGRSYESGLDYLAENFPAGMFIVSILGELPPQVFGGELVPAGAQPEINPVAGEGEFAVPFTPVLTVLPNGGISLTVDARAAVSLARAVINTTQTAPDSQDGRYLAPLGEVLAENPSHLFDDAVETLFRTPFGE